MRQAVFLVNYINRFRNLNMIIEKPNEQCQTLHGTYSLGRRFSMKMPTYYVSHHASPPLHDTT
ncbi:hypothetical protein HanXRQr2_Chr10g0446291 [Helianthus annuus]|uniref:Uncharacterized protein n=1 Tax=Helianthus annuus TaxID=4232 RepID=A0A251TIA1_HELAN|nr:hypothetical protein HanXRQr2_Chr10g0446291 [Helianthus annuus]